MATGVILAGTAISAIGVKQANDAAAEGAKNQARAREAQAAEVLRKSRIEEVLQRREGEVVFGDTVSAFAKSGVDVASGSALAVLTETKTNIENMVARNKQDSENEARLLRAGASSLRNEARSIRSASPLQTVGTLLGGAGRAIAGGKTNAKDTKI